MLYPTLNQPLMLLVLFFSGVLGGVIFNIFGILKVLSSKDKGAVFLFDFIPCVLSALLLYFVNMNYNYGQFRVYVILVYLGSLILTRVISKFLWTKLVKRCYNKLGRQNEQRQKK